MTSYNKSYMTPDLFGEPYMELIEFFEKYPHKGAVLDLGCGQGRNAVALARMGYQVTGLNISGIGIDQMNEKAKADKLLINGFTGDMYQFSDFVSYDIILLDSMFHFAKRDSKRETGFIRKIISAMKNGTLLCICILDTGKNVKILKQTISEAGIIWENLTEISLFYHFTNNSTGHRSKSTYFVYVIKKN